MAGFRRPMMKRNFVVTGFSPSSRRITFESSSDVTKVFDRYGSLLDVSFHSNPDRFSYTLYISSLYSFYEVLDYIRTRQLILNGVKEYEDTPEDDKKEEPFDFIAFINAAATSLEEQERPEPKSFEPDPEEDLPIIVIIL